MFSNYENTNRYENVKQGPWTIRKTEARSPTNSEYDLGPTGKKLPTQFIHEKCSRDSCPLLPPFPGLKPLEF
jgi:hypothetical protein